MNNCEGCLTYSTSDAEHCKDDNSNGECPCTACVIKVMCNDSCKTFNDFRDKALEDGR